MAIKLGFAVVLYVVGSNTPQQRDAGQADHLYRKVFAKDSNARLFVHAGYAHIDKAQGRLHNAIPLAMHLQELTGIEPLSIDQTQFQEQIPREPGAHQILVMAFRPDGPPF